eukprot:8706012-Ditylum_brightwellii.AAC.1
MEEWIMTDTSEEEKEDLKHEEIISDRVGIHVPISSFTLVTPKSHTGLSPLAHISMNCTIYLLLLSVHHRGVTYVLQPDSSADLEPSSMQVLTYVFITGSPKWELDPCLWLGKAWIHLTSMVNH